MFDMVIHNGILVTPLSMKRGQIGIKDGKIAEILYGEGLELPPTVQTINAEGKLIYAGLIDTHVHMNDPGFTWREDFAHGSRAAAVGGVTMVIDMPMQNEPAVSSAKILLEKEQHLTGKAHIDYALWGALLPEQQGTLAEMHKAGAVAFKAFFAPVSPDYKSVTAQDIRQSLQCIADFGGLAGFHCEDYSIIQGEQEKAIAERRWRAEDFLKARPVSAERIAVQTVLSLAAEVGARVHICHVSHPEVAEQIRQAKAGGVRVSAETCPHYLVFTEQDVVKKGTALKCAPPLRTAEDAAKLWDYVLDGTLDCMCSDHSPCTPQEKEIGAHGFFDAWGGMSGVQTTAQVFFHALVHEKKESPTHFARVMASRPAEIFGLNHQKGNLQVGLDADITVIDPLAPWEITSESLQYLNLISAFVGCKGKGAPVMTILRGEIVAQDGKPVHTTQAHGQCVRHNNCRG